MNQFVKAQPYGPIITITKIEYSNHMLRNYLRRIRGIAQKTKTKVAQFLQFYERRCLTNNSIFELLSLELCITGMLRKIYQSTKRAKN
ncbi:hypothetical protein PR048_009785 [Dryococelus australis]|uniref:Uncharacterized protein n=1 Tax=Dryococelus australis TaxID=614101 RepID=A0ABQ9I0W9_9NEOP|nr:hypothetical protein PR048_009785 [Dryococelus australis]